MKQIFIDVEINPMVRSVRAIKWIKKDQDKNNILKVKNDKKKTREVWTRFSSVWFGQVFTKTKYMLLHSCQSKR